MKSADDLRGMAPNTYAVYILASRSRVLYLGATNDLARRAEEHDRGLAARFLSKYGCNRSRDRARGPER